MITNTMKKFPIPAYLWSEWTQMVMELYPNRSGDFVKSYSENQLSAKSWLTEHIKVNYITDSSNKEIWILGSWYGTVLVPLLRNALKNPKIILVDYDEENLEIAKMIHSDIEVKCLDVTFDLPGIKTDIIINTSCEHMYPMKDIPMEGMCFYQSNNFNKDPAHINCVDTLDDFANQSGIENPKAYQQNFHKYDDFHKRFMVYGQRTL